MELIPKNYYSNKCVCLRKRAFTLVEILVDLTMVSIVSIAVLSAYMISIKTIASSKVKIASVSLANEQMENIRNMSYASVGLANSTSAFIPIGEIQEETEIIRGGETLRIKTTVSFVDDPFDGCSSTSSAISDECRQNLPAESTLDDSYEFDYKRVDVTITRTKNDVVMAKLSSNFSSKTAETSLNTGQMNICVTDSNGVKIAGATVTISNTVLPSFGSKAYTTTNDDCLKVPNLTPVADRSYHIVVTKTTSPTYNSDQTYPINSSTPNPVNPDVNITAQEVTTVNFTLERNSTAIRMNLRDSSGNIITPSCVGEVPHSLTIDRADEWEIGTNVNTNLHDPDGDITIDNKSIVYTPIDLFYIYNQATNRLSGNYQRSPYMRSNVIDGNDLTYWLAGVVPNQKVHTPAYWMMDLGGVYDVTKIQLKFAQDKFKVEWAPNTSDYNNLWTQIDIDPATIDSGQIFFSPINMRYIKITNLSDVPTDEDRVYELKLFQSIAMANHITALTQIDSGINTDGTYKIRQWQNFRPNEEDSNTKNSEPVGRLDGTNIYYSFRYSNTATDNSWTSWTVPAQYNGGLAGDSSRTLSLSSTRQMRYLQVRTDFFSTDASKTPVLHDYTIKYTTCLEGSGAYQASLPMRVISTRNISDPIYLADGVTIQKPAVPKYSYSPTIASRGTATTSIYTQVVSAGVWGNYMISLNTSSPLTNGWYIVATKPMQNVYKDPLVRLDVEIYVTQDPELPRVSNISPSTAISNGNTTLTITGSVFDSSDSISIKHEGTIINSTNVELISPSEIQADFDLSGAPVGLWDVIITNPQGNSTTQFSGVYDGPSGTGTIISGLLVKSGP